MLRSGIGCRPNRSLKSRELIRVMFFESSATIARQFLPMLTGKRSLNSIDKQSRKRRHVGFSMRGFSLAMDNGAELLWGVNTVSIAAGVSLSGFGRIMVGAS